MQYTTITKENIHLILYRLQRFVQKMEVVAMQNYYPTASLLKSITKEKSDYNYITHSQVSYLDSNDYLLEIETEMGNLPFIRCNYQNNNSAFLLKVGYKIKILPNHIYIKKAHILYENKPQQAHLIETWCKGDKKLSDQQSRWVDVTGKMYDEICKMKYEEDLFDFN